jgi:DNA-binding transcriptional MerR regulator
VLEREVSLLAIGEFAALVGLSSKTLRRYSDAGLIPPTRVDRATGYRWYAVSQLEDARLVVLLRRLNMPVGAVRAVLDVTDAERRWREIAAFWSDRRQRLADEDRLLERLRQQILGQDDPRSLEPSDLDALAEPARSEVVAAMAEVTLPAALPVFTQGDVADALYVVASGSVAVLVTVDGADGPLEVATLGAGQLFGELALLDGSPRTATIVTKEPTTLLRLECSTFAELVAAFPDIEQGLRAVAASR